MPKKSSPGQWQMSNPNRKGNQIWIQRMPGMLAKELRIRGKQAGIEDLQNPRKVDFRVFRIRMIAMNQKRNGGQGQQAYKDFNLQKESLHGNQYLMLSSGFRRRARVRKVFSRIPAVRRRGQR